MKIAVVGSGISGLSAAWLLSSQHEVTLFEKDSVLGGHAHTATVSDSTGNKIAVDTGFMVFNPEQYPNLVQLLKHFNVLSTPTSMSFAVSMDNGAFEYSSNVPSGIFADHHNVIRVSFYEFLLEITRFNATARKALSEGISPHQTLWEWLQVHNFSEDLGEKYLLPLIGSVWSTPKELARDFPCGELLTFLNSHHLLAVTNLPTWRTIVGGSQIYVESVASEIRARGGDIRLNHPVTSIARYTDHIVIESKKKKDTFDYVVCATHADQTLTLLKRPTREEKVLLSKFTYERNTVYLHSDDSLMPRRKEAWASWNYLGYSGWSKRTKKVCLTYHMNSLQHLATDLPVFVTLNPIHKPKKSLTHEVYSYAHPLCTCTSMEMRSQLSKLQNKNRTLFCGAYFGYGFHEDGITSAIEAVSHLNATPPWGKTTYEK